MPKFLFEYLTYADGESIPNGWWRIDGDKLKNRYGGFHSYTPKKGDVIVEADDWSDLDYGYLIDNESDHGWIDREGKFYGCKREAHSAVADLVFKKSERQLEEEGWVKVFSLWGRAEPTYYVEDRLTEAQEKCLIDRGIL